jgi:hypothetical protein
VVEEVLQEEAVDLEVAEVAIEQLINTITISTN